MELYLGEIPMKTVLTLRMSFKKKALRVIAFSSFDHPSSPLYKLLEIIKLPDLFKLTVAIVMYKYHYHLLPSAFQSFFTSINEVH